MRPIYGRTRVLFVVIAPVVAGLSLACYLRFATIYSALYGLSSEAGRVETAKRWGLFCLWSLVGSEVISVTAFSGLIRLQYVDLPPLMKNIARFGIAFCLSVAGTLLVLLAVYEYARKAA